MLIRVYQVTISPFLGQRCRYYPSCSEYTRLCFHKYPAHLALRQSVGRLFRCTPFHSGGIDLP